MQVKFVTKRKPSEDGEIRCVLWQVSNGYVLARINDAGIYRMDWSLTPSDNLDTSAMLGTQQATELLQQLLAGTADLVAYGTDFQCAVWREVAKIPYAQTCSYAAIARSLGIRSARAVGGAVGKNPLYVVIPCHRVISSDGSLGGYGWGLEHKQALLNCEARGKNWFVL